MAVGTEADRETGMALGTEMEITETDRATAVEMVQETKETGIDQNQSQKKSDVE